MLHQQIAALLPAAALCALAAGCGINKSRLATEQAVVSDAVDKTVASIDFSPLSGKKVYFDTQYLDGVNMGPNGNIKYVVSSLRQQMMAYDLRLQEAADKAEFIVEARVGVLANDGYELTYGIPGSAAVMSASALLASPIPAPAMPELSLGRKNTQVGNAKIGLFAFDRVTREPVWQAGVRKGASEARDTWFLGLGPYQHRTTDKPSIAGRLRKAKREAANVAQDPLAAYSDTIVFERAARPMPPVIAEPARTQVAPASFQQPVEPKPIPLPATGTPAPKPLKNET
jgi:hypothetical protein